MIRTKTTDFIVAAHGISNQAPSTSNQHSLVEVGVSANSGELGAQGLGRGPQDAVRKGELNLRVLYSKHRKHTDGSGLMAGKDLRGTGWWSRACSPWGR